MKTNMKNLILVLLLLAVASVFAKVDTFAKVKSNAQKVTSKSNLNSNVKSDNSVSATSTIKENNLIISKESNINCSHIQFWNKIVSYNQGDKAMLLGLLYESRKNKNIDVQPKGLCKTDKKCEEKKLEWKYIGRCKLEFGMCRKLRKWKKGIWPEKVKVKWHRHAWISTKVTKLEAEPGKSKVWKKLGKCRKGLKCNKLPHWTNVNFKKGTIVTLDSYAWLALRSIKAGEMPEKSLAWKKLGSCKRIQIPCKGILKWKNLKGEYKYKRGTTVRHLGHIYISSINTNEIPTCKSKHECAKIKSKWIYLGICERKSCEGFRYWLRRKWYKKGALIRYHGFLYKSLDLNLDHKPGNIKNWKRLGKCKHKIPCSRYKTWNDSKWYSAGDRISFKNKIWIATRRNRNKYPGGKESDFSWKILTKCGKRNHGDHQKF